MNRQIDIANSAMGRKYTVAKKIKCEAEKCSDGIQRGKFIGEKNVRQGGAKSWMENAPRNILRIVWEQLRRQPGLTSTAAVYKPGGARTSVDCNSYEKLGHQTREPLYNTDYKTNHELRLDERRPVGTLRIHTKTHFV